MKTRSLIAHAAILIFLTLPLASSPSVSAQSGGPYHLVWWSVGSGSKLIGGDIIQWRVSLVNRMPVNTKEATSHSPAASGEQATDSASPLIKHRNFRPLKRQWRILTFHRRRRLKRQLFRMKSRHCNCRWCNASEGANARGSFERR
jgi:hypothetical protein